MRNLITTFDPFFDLFFTENKSTNSLMKTDIKEKKDHYEMKIDLPSISKDNIKISLKDGYLTVTASYNDEEEKEDVRYLYRERRYQEASRNYYVGEEVTLSDLSAKLENGVLEININKVEPKKEEEHYLTIN